MPFSEVLFMIVILSAVGSFVFPNGTVCQNSGVGNIGCNNNGNFNFG